MLPAYEVDDFYIFAFDKPEYLGELRVDHYNKNQYISKLNEWKVKAGEYFQGAEIPQMYLEPYKYIRFFKSSVALLGTGLRLDVTTKWQRKTIQRIMERWDPDYDRHPTILQDMHSFFCGSYIETYFSDYYKSLLLFKTQCGLGSFPPLDLFSSVVAVDGALYYLGNHAMGKSTQWKALTEHALKCEVSFYGGTYRPERGLVKNLVSNLISYHKANDLEEKRYDIRYSEGGLELYQTMERAKYYQTDIQTIYPVLGIGYGKPACSPALKESLYSLTDGDSACLYELARMIGTALAEEQPSEKLWVISGPGAVGFSSGLSYLLSYRFSSNLYKNYRYMAIDQLEHCLIQINDKFIPPDKFRNVNHAVLLKTIQGIEFSDEDHDAIYSCQKARRKPYCPAALLVIDGQYKDYAPVLKRIPHCSLVIPGNWSWERFTMTDLAWLRSGFAVYGLVGAKEKDEKKTIPLDEAVARFAAECCEAGTDDDRLKGKTFYQYFNLYKNRITDAMTEEWKQKEVYSAAEKIFGKRKMDRKQNNILCFYGIRIKENSIPKEENESPAEKETGRLSREDFFALLDRISENIIWAN